MINEAAVRNAALEEAAKVCDEYHTALACAQAIRALTTPAALGDIPVYIELPPVAPAAGSIADDESFRNAAMDYRGASPLNAASSYETMCMLADARALAAQPAPVSAHVSERGYPVIELGKGLIEVAEGHQDSIPALIFGRNGTGTIGEATESNRTMQAGECLAAVTFGNAASVDVVLMKLNQLRAAHWPAQPAAPVAVAAVDVAPGKEMASEIRGLTARLNEYRAKLTESEESRLELLRLLNAETGGSTFMGEPALVASQVAAVDARQDAGAGSLSATAYRTVLDCRAKTVTLHFEEYDEALAFYKGVWPVKPTTTPAPGLSVDAGLSAGNEAMPAQFGDWFKANYPADTLIHDPEWHAPKIYWRAIAAFKASTPKG